jgi:hypothetical protein
MKAPHSLPKKTTDEKIGTLKHTWGLIKKTSDEKGGTPKHKGLD